MQLFVASFSGPSLRLGELHPAVNPFLDLGLRQRFDVAVEIGEIGAIQMAVDLHFGLNLPMTILRHLSEA